MPPIKFVSNADPSYATQAINLESGTLLLGGPALEATDEELRNLQANGTVVVEVAKESEVESTEKPLSDLSNTDLRQIANDEGVDVTGLRTNAQLADAIEENRSKTSEPAEVSATATGTSSASPSITETG